MQSADDENEALQRREIAYSDRGMGLVLSACGTAARNSRYIGVTSPSDYFRYAQQCARLASDEKCQDYLDSLIEIAAVLTQLGWLKFQNRAETAFDTEPELRLRARPAHGQATHARDHAEHASKAHTGEHGKK
jgi:hypothetical protein